MDAGKTGEIVVNVKITKFRLRSGSAAFWLGVMAGADTIRCSVEVTRPGAAPSVFQTDTSTGLGGIITPGTVTRFNRLTKELAKRIAAGV